MTDARESSENVAGEPPTSRLRALENRLDEVETAVLLTAAAQSAPDGADGGGAADTRFPSMQAWVEQYFVHCYVRPVGGEWRWCARWWDHAEAITRLEALWRAWETLSRNPTLGMAIWLTNHLDPQLPHLLGNRGPFGRCTDDRHESTKPFRTEPVPDGWWKPTGSS